MPRVGIPSAAMEKYYSSRCLTVEVVINGKIPSMPCLKQVPWSYIQESLEQAQDFQVLQVAVCMNVEQ